MREPGLLTFFSSPQAASLKGLRGKVQRKCVPSPGDSCSWAGLVFLPWVSDSLEHLVLDSESWSPGSWERGAVGLLRPFLPKLSSLRPWHGIQAVFLFPDFPLEVPGLPSLWGPAEAPAGCHLALRGMGW